MNIEAVQSLYQLGNDIQALAFRMIQKQRVTEDIERDMTIYHHRLHNLAAKIKEADHG